jgi:DNA-binding MarR family transcriptional regulator
MSSGGGIPEPMAKRFGYAIKRAQHALRARMDETLRPLGLTAPQYAVLSAVELDAGISNASLARAAFVTPQTMQGILANLERENLVVRTADPGHGRILRSELTRQGRTALLRAHRLVMGVERAMITAIGDKQTEKITPLLLRCAQALAEPANRGADPNARRRQTRRCAAREQADRAQH